MNRRNRPDLIQQDLTTKSVPRQIDVISPSTVLPFLPSSVHVRRFTEISTTNRGPGIRGVNITQLFKLHSDQIPSEGYTFLSTNLLFFPIPDPKPSTHQDHAQVPRMWW